MCLATKAKPKLASMLLAQTNLFVEQTARGRPIFLFVNSGWGSAGMQSCPGVSPERFAYRAGPVFSSADLHLFSLCIRRALTPYTCRGFLYTSRAEHQHSRFFARLP